MVLSVMHHHTCHRLHPCVPVNRAHARIRAHTHRTMHYFDYCDTQASVYLKAFFVHQHTHSSKKRLFLRTGTHKVPKLAHARALTHTRTETCTILTHVTNIDPKHACFAQSTLKALNALMRAHTLAHAHNMHYFDCCHAQESPYMKGFLRTSNIKRMRICLLQDK